MSSREVITSFWWAMADNDWERAAAHLVEGCQIDWPCSGERIVGRRDFAAVQAQYPSRTGRWGFYVHRIIADGPTVVSEVTVSDGDQSARLVAFSEVQDGLIRSQVEYWPAAYDPLPGREELTQRIPRIP